MTIVPPVRKAQRSAERPAPKKTRQGRRADSRPSEPGANRPPLQWTNVHFLLAAHLVAAFGVVYLAAIHFSWWTVGLGLVWAALSGLAVTAGYHRHFSHRTYEAHALVRAFYLLFGAAAVQNSALKWSADHRRHHARTDREGDPYNIRRGFWWAHIGWVFYADDDESITGVDDLGADRLVRFQHQHYVLIALVMGALLPAALGFVWGDPLGALLVAGFVRLVVLWHAAFAVNSVAHTIGGRPFSTAVSARDCFLTALITLGEGYHNFHHRFQRDYRNGIRWWHVDPTKWFVWALSKLGLTWNLRRTPETLIRQAREAVARARAAREPGASAG